MLTNSLRGNAHDVPFFRCLIDQTWPLIWALRGLAACFRLLVGVEVESDTD